MDVDLQKKINQRNIRDKAEVKETQKNSKKGILLSQLASYIGSFMN